MVTDAEIDAFIEEVEEAERDCAADNEEILKEEPDYVCSACQFNRRAVEIIKHLRSKQ